MIHIRHIRHIRHITSCRSLPVGTLILLKHQTLGAVLAGDGTPWWTRRGWTAGPLCLLAPAIRCRCETPISMRCPSCFTLQMTNIIKHVVNVVLIKILNKTSEDPARIPESCWHKDSNFIMSAFACFCQVHRTGCSPFKQSFRRSALPGALDTAKFMFLLLRRPFPLTLSLWSGSPPPRCKKSSRLHHSQSRVNMTSSNKRQLLGWQIKSCWIMLNHELTALNSISCPVAGEWASLPLGF